ncbi:MAG: hypothetical protein KJO65_08035 [Gemmatimonadetes bacterium]|nr:hypothetical protein [Gemmatimonadota bacterium]
MSSRSTNSLGMAAVSVVILTTIMLQGLAGFRITFGPIEGPPFLWPFLNYPMYAIPRYSGDSLERRVLIGVLDDSTEVVIGHRDLDMTFWQFQSVFDDAVLGGEVSLAEAFREMFEERYDGQLAAFRLEDHPVILTRDGYEVGSPVVLGVLFFEGN